MARWSVPVNEDQPKMKTIEVYVGVGLVGCKRTETFEIEADATDNEIEEAARDFMFNMIEWGWEIK